ncbi:MAG: ATP-binding protein, partial [Lachnospiraceae bacterium]|nr:ATP-binding protein [Lachnospiraceae bacterium]
MKRVTLFTGHYGSGKSNLAVNYALRLKSAGLRVALADMDIVNPYFRSADSRTELTEAGVRVIALP